jgi:phosphomannomutase
LAGLLSSGARVVDVDICPVPTIQNAVRKLRAKGGIAITASHNPAQWNALKFIKSTGCFLNPYEAEELIGLYHQQEFRQAHTSVLQPLEIYDGAVRDHLRGILEGLKPRMEPGLKVAIDCCNGAGAVMTPELMKALNCEIVELGCTPDGRFPRPPEPTPENLGQLCELVASSGADLGFAQDADADRLAVVSEKGVAIGEEYTLALCARAILERERGPVVVNLSTSRMVEDIAADFDCPVHRSRIGEVNVTEAMIEYQAVFGGEGNGGVIYPRVNMARDSFVGITIILDLLRSTGSSLSGLLNQLPRYKMAKYAYEIHPHRIPELVARLSSLYSSETIDLRDGIKINRSESWVHVRASNTEPIVRLAIEAKEESTLQALRAEFSKHFEDSV